MPTAESQPAVMVFGFTLTDPTRSLHKLKCNMYIPDNPRTDIGTLREELAHSPSQAL